MIAIFLFATFGALLQLLSQMLFANLFRLAAASFASPGVGWIAGLCWGQTKTAVASALVASHAQQIETRRSRKYDFLSRGICLACFFF